MTRVGDAGAWSCFSKRLRQAYYTLQSPSAGMILQSMQVFATDSFLLEFLAFEPGAQSAFIEYIVREWTAGLSALRSVQ